MKTIQKILFKIDLAEQTNDPEIFKKLNSNIWEFRIRNGNQRIRLLAFWDNNQKGKNIVVVTGGFIKKDRKTDRHEIEKAEKKRRMWLTK